MHARIERHGGLPEGAPNVDAVALHDEPARVRLRGDVDDDAREKRREALGVLARGLRNMGVDWNPLLNGDQAALLIILAAAWKQISYNFLFFLAGLQSIPKSVIEAAAIDGARPMRRFWTVIFPLLSPTIFFLLVVNTVYVFFETFGIIDAVTGGGPAGSTVTMVYKVYADGRLGGDLGGSAAQSVVLMVIVIALTAIQFRYVERKVQY